MRGPGKNMFMFLGALLLSGCSGYRVPAITVTEVAVTEVTDDAVAVAFVLDIRNPNDEALQIHEFRYTLAVDGKQVYAGRRAPDATLSAAATQQTTLPAVIPNHRLGWTAEARPTQARYALSGKLVYLVPSTFAKILFDSGVRRPRASFSKRGQFAFASAEPDPEP